MEKRKERNIQRTQNTPKVQTKILLQKGESEGNIIQAESEDTVDLRFESDSEDTLDDVQRT